MMVIRLLDADRRLPASRRADPVAVRGTALQQAAGQRGAAAAAGRVRGGAGQLRRQWARGGHLHRSGRHATGE